MSLKSCFLKVYNLEQKYGSLIKGMLKLQKEAKKTGKRLEQVRAAFSPHFTMGWEL